MGEVLREVRERAPGIGLAVVSSAPERLFRRAVPAPFAFRHLDCDVGLAQAGALVIDEAATAKRWREWAQGQGTRVASEAAWLRERGANVVFADIPPLAFDAAAQAGIPSVGMANFSWDWIYRHLSRRQPGLAEAADAAAVSYRKARLLLQLPFAGDLAAFPRREAIPLVARRPTRGKEEVRRALGLPSGPVALFSFGGLGLADFDLGVLARLDGFHFVLAGDEQSLAPNLRVVPPARLEALGLGYEDLVGGVDVVVTKPGYGIVSDAIGARTRLVYTDRGDFPEYPILVAGMAKYLPCAYVSHEDLRGGRLGGAIESVLAVPFPEPPDLSGAAVAAEWLLEREA